MTINMIGNYLFIDDYGLMSVSIATLIASSALLVLFIIKAFSTKKTMNILLQLRGSLQQWAWKSDSYYS